MHKKIKTVLIPIAIMLSVAAFACICYSVYGVMSFFGETNDRDNHNPKMPQEMLKTTKEWCRLAPLPESNTNFTIKAEGSALTRAFRCTFDLPKEDLAGWVALSPGLQDAEITGGTVKTYVISPGGGAMHAEATIDFESGHVDLFTYWS